ncbi:GNAT family N-acetyltransferase [Streptomyces sp. NPDC057445]|uniref:GNAT family N-acetyltransferase n=1 Tax=Streptomyces sp. NPDC057445 TaxID=3346136 RepID=UPI003674A403
MEYVIRALRADEWAKAREIRLAALQDPAAPVAFLETYEQAAARPDSFWQARALGATGDEAHQFVAAAPDGSWAGTISVLVERPDSEVRFGEAAKTDQTHLVGVYVRPEARGSGVADALFRAGVEWSWALGGDPIRRVRLYVHERNSRAAAFYRRFGFVASGATAPVPGEETAQEHEYELLRPEQS